MKEEKNKKLLNKETLIKDLNQLAKSFSKDHPYSDSYITQTYYRNYGKFTDKEFNFLFGDFTTFKTEAIHEIKEDFTELVHEKQILRLTTELKILRKDKEYLLKNKINEEKLINCYEQNLDKNVKLNISKIIKTKKKTDLRAVLNLCDIHLGETVELQSVNSVNEFNKNIAVERLDQLFNKFVHLCHQYNIDQCDIILNGDLISGGIHTELERNRDLNEVESIFFLQKYMNTKLIELTNWFNQINVDVIVGNHSRIIPGRPYYKEKVTMNYEYIFGKQLQLYFQTLQKEKNPKIIINVPESLFIIKNINGTKFLVTHGDVLTGAGTGGFAGIPFYSLAMSSAKLYGVLHQIGINTDTQFDHIICGHLHTTTKIPIFNGGYCFVGGCVIGTNEFSLMKMKSVAKKEQLMLILDKEGCIDAEINIKLN